MSKTAEQSDDSYPAHWFPKVKRDTTTPDRRHLEEQLDTLTSDEILDVLNSVLGRRPQQG